MAVVCLWHDLFLRLTAPAGDDFAGPDHCGRLGEGSQNDVCVNTSSRCKESIRGIAALSAARPVGRDLSDIGKDRLLPE